LHPPLLLDQSGKYQEFTNSDEVVGLFVGIPVGGLGLFVGVPVGDFDGFAVTGLSVGLFVGDFDGLAVGFLVV